MFTLFMFLINDTCFFCDFNKVVFTSLILFIKNKILQYLLANSHQKKI